MPVGRRRSVWTSHSWRSLRRTVSPAPPSKRTLSGTTTAARPLILRMVLTCWTKLSCLFEVVVQKSSRTTVSASRSCWPSSLTTSMLDFLPKGGFVGEDDVERFDGNLGVVDDGDGLGDEAGRRVEVGCLF